MRTIRQSLYRLKSTPPAGILLFAVLSTLAWWFGMTQPALLARFYPISRLDIYYLRAFGTPALIRIVFSFLIIAASYWAAYRLAEKASGKHAWAAIFVGFALQAAVLLLMAPFTSTDIFDNIAHGRIIAVYHANPFKLLTANFPYDPFTRFAGWPFSPSAYGPLWEYMAAAAAFLAGNGIFENVVAFKLLPGAFWLGCSLVVALILIRQNPRYALRGALLMAWNPVALFEVWGNGHNDPAFLLFILLAVWALLDQHFSLALLALTAGTLVKFMPALLLPAAGLIALQQLPSWRARLGFLVRTAPACLALVLVAYAPFWQGLTTLSLDRRAHLFATSLGSSLLRILSQAVGIPRAASIITPLAAALTIGFALWMAYRAWRSPAPDRFALAAMLTLAFYLLVTVLFFWPWYTIWLIALVPLVRDRQLRTLAILFSFASLSKDFVAYLGMNDSMPTIPQPWMEIWLTVRIMLIPWGYALYSLASRWRKRDEASRGMFNLPPGSSRSTEPMYPAAISTQQEGRGHGAGRYR